MIKNVCTEKVSSKMPFLKAPSKVFLMNPYVELMRPYNGILAILGIIIGAIVGMSLSAPLSGIIFAIIVAFLVNGAGNVINDYFDVEIDKINRPKRPIPSGKVKRQNALNYFILLTAISLVLSYFVSLHFLYMAIANSIVSFVYSWKLKKTPFIGNVAVSWLAASTFMAGALIAHTFYSLAPAVMILALIAFLGTLSREIFKDMEDVEGDKKAGAKTLPIAIGGKKAGIVAVAITIIAILSLLLPVYYALFDAFYYIGMVPAAVICLAAIAKMKNPHKSQKMLKISMYFVFLGFILGTFL